LAEPGQGKTYLCRHLAAELVSRKSSPQVIPLFVEAAQWVTVPPNDQKSLWKIIVNSFRHFEAPIPWVQDCESDFLRATLKAGLFRIIFDGFDEYILKNPNSLSLGELASSTGARIVLTSRTSFWTSNLDPEEAKSFLEKSGAFPYKLEPFTREYARTYFSGRLTTASDKERAEKCFDALLSRAKNAEILGRGFVLDLIADIAEKGGKIQPTAGVSELLGLVTALCQREKLRQDLPFSDTEQIGFLKEIATESAQGELITDALLDLAIQQVCPSLDAPSRANAQEKLRSHPLLRRVEKAWYFAQEQVEVLLLADSFIHFPANRRRLFVSRMKITSGTQQDLISMTLDLMNEDGEEALLKNLKTLLSELDASRGVTAPSSGFIGPGVLRTAMALMAIEKVRPKGTVRRDRSALLHTLFGGERLTREVFTGVISGFDLTQTIFDSCEFDQVLWVNCKFSKSTRFSRCRFIGTGGVVRCEGFGNAEFTDIHGDPQAIAVINNERVKSGSRSYTIDDLRNDFESVLHKFVGRTGAGLSTVEARHLTRGVIAYSRYRDEILDELQRTVIQHHSISGLAEGGFNVRENSVEAMKFFANNNTYIGPIRQAFDALKESLRIAR
jgi:hypothetical protein